MKRFIVGEDRHQITLLPASLDAFPALLNTLSEPPRFDAIVGMDLLSKTTDAYALISALQPFARPEACLVWAESNLSRAQGFSELLSLGNIEASLLGKVADLEKEWRQSLAPSSNYPGVTHPSWRSP